VISPQLAATKNKALNEALTWESTMESKPAAHLHAVPTVADAAVLSKDVDAEFIARSKAISITLNDLFRGTDEIEKLPSGEMNWDGRMECLTRIFRGRRDKAFVVNSRLEAMSRLVTGGKVPHGVVPTDIDGRNVLAHSVFLAAAEMPILFHKKEPYFEPEPFAAFVLKDARACGDVVLRAVRSRR
jgi:hypothetical protein